MPVWYREDRRGRMSVRTSSGNEAQACPEQLQARGTALGEVEGVSGGECTVLAIISKSGGEEGPDERPHALWEGGPGGGGAHEGLLGSRRRGFGEKKDSALEYAGVMKHE